jgi:dihydrodipicolinate synthase/N-acetylneuraminate lyase
MEKGMNTHKKKEMVSRPFKYIIAAASVAGTLGLWGIFSQAEVQNNTVTTVDALPTVATLVADAGVSSSSDVAASTTSNNTIDALPVVTQPTTSVSSQQNGTVNYYSPAPVTSTRSSR